jgi:hypothetical protein
MTDQQTVRQGWGMCCPKCGRDGEIDIQMSSWRRLHPLGTDDDAVNSDGYSWTDDSAAICGHCGHEGRVAEFASAGTSR